MTTTMMEIIWWVHWKYREWTPNPDMKSHRRLPARQVTAKLSSEQQIIEGRVAGLEVSISGWPDREAY